MTAVTRRQAREAAWRLVEYLNDGAPLELRLVALHLASAVTTPGPKRRHRGRRVDQRIDATVFAEQLQTLLAAGAR